MKNTGLWPTILEYFGQWWYVVSRLFASVSCADIAYRRFQRSYYGIRVVENILDMKARMTKAHAWLYGLATHGLGGAHLAAAGLKVS